MMNRELQDALLIVLSFMLGCNTGYYWYILRNKPPTIKDFDDFIIKAAQYRRNEAKTANKPKL